MSNSLPLASWIAASGWDLMVWDNRYQFRHSTLVGAVSGVSTRSWLCLAYPLPNELIPNYSGSGPADRESELGYRLLHRNREIYLVRFGLDRQRRPSLFADIPLVGDRRLMLCQCLEAIRRYGSESLSAVRQSGLRRIGVGVSAERKSSEAGISQPVLRQFLKALEPCGWHPKEEPAGKMCWIGYSGRLRAFEAQLTITQFWTSIQLPLLLNPASAFHAVPAARRLLIQYLLRLQSGWYAAKLSAGDAEQILLQLEFPTEALDVSLFRMAAQTLGTYIDRHAHEIQIMALLDRDPRLLRALDRADLQVATP